MRFLLAFMLMFALPVTYSVKASALQTNCKVTSQSDVTVTTTSTKFLSSDARRACLIVVNKGAATIYIKFQSAHSGTEGIALAANGTWESLVPPMDAVYMKAASGTVTTAVIAGD